MTTAFKLSNGTILLSTEAPGGIYNAAQLKKIASLCEGDSVIVKATEDQRLALSVKPEMAAAIAEQLQSIGLGVRHYQDGLHHPTSCIGELCPDHEQDALGTALDISEVLNELTLETPLKIGINGCAKCCIPCHTLDISIIGDASGYRVNLGGKNSQLPEMASFMAEGVPPQELPKLIKTIVELYKSQADASESLQEVIERVGATEYIKALSPYSQDAAGESDPFTAPAEIEAPIEPSPDDLMEEAEVPDTLELETMPEMDSLEMSSEMLDIDPQGSSSSDDLGEVQISSETDSVPDIQLEPDFAEDNLDISTEDQPAKPPTEMSLDSVDLEPLGELEDPMLGADIEDSLPSDDIEDMDEGDFDLNESKIDVSDVMKTPPAAQVIPASQDLEVVEASSEEDESAYEEKLTESINAHEDLLEDPAIEENRDKALETLGETESSLDDEYSESNTSDSTEAFDSLSTTGNPIFTEVAIDDSEDDFDMVEVEPLPLSEIVSTKQKHHVELVTSSYEPEPSKQGWAFSGLDVDASGYPVIVFANGVQLTLSKAAITAGSISVGGHTLRLTEAPGGLEVHFIGMKMFLPAAA